MSKKVYEKQNSPYVLFASGQYSQAIDLININVDGIMTDKPTTLKKVLQKKSLWN